MHKQQVYFSLDKKALHEQQESSSIEKHRTKYPNNKRISRSITKTPYKEVRE